MIIRRGVVARHSAVSGAGRVPSATSITDPQAAWTPAYDADRTVRDGAWVAELTGVLNWAACVVHVVDADGSTPDNIGPFVANSANGTTIPRAEWLVWAAMALNLTTLRWR